MSAMSNEVQIMFSGGGQFYLIPEIKRDCMLWLSITKRPLPVPSEWRRPGSLCACVMRDRGYYRLGSFELQAAGVVKAISLDDELVKDYGDAAWWTPGLEEAWVELQGMKEAMAEAIKPHQPPPSPPPEDESGGAGKRRGKH
jgi:hypothetical protein